ncbi:helix-turn-helix domain-containing protein [Geobacter sp.]|uniref:helix-turn-helix domain-containing protein n=1 Tax=Geobacter sp. TaxID=46610 RepID=UPI0027BAB26D|nr:helix-turn-helix transcriptional regulator [Geobacter sp.]
MGLRKPSSTLTRILAENLRFLRQQKALSQEELAELCGIHRTYVGSVEREERNVTLSTLELFAKALKVSVPNLLTKNLGNHDDSNKNTR